MSAHDNVDDPDIDLIASSITLRNGVIVPNRLVKAAMEEGLGMGGGLPDIRHRRLYKRWAQGGWGIIITGNVQVDPSQLATPHDRTIPPHPHTIPIYIQLQETIQSTSLLSNHPPPLTLVQLSHAGIQSSSVYSLRAPWVRAVGPCAARPEIGSGVWAWIVARLMWPRKSRVLGVEQWGEIVDKFVEAGRNVEEAGWGGVQIHAAHGYLIAEYISPLTNPYPSPLPGVPSSIPLRLHLLWLILTGIAEVTESSFVKAVKINCSDFVQGGLDEEQAVEIIKEVVSWQLVDILEISGGSYTHPEFCLPESLNNQSPRQSLFAHFTTQLLPHLPPPPLGPAIMLTGGLHSRPLIASSIRTRACDIVGIARPACLQPCIPSEVILNPLIKGDETNVGKYIVPGAEGARWILGGGRMENKKEKEDDVSGKTEVTKHDENSFVEETQSRKIKGKGKNEATKDVTAENDSCKPLSRSHSKPQTKPSSKSTGIKLVGAGVYTMWHEWQLCRIGRGLDPDPNMDWWIGAMYEAVWWNILGGGPWGWIARLRGG